MALLEVNGIQKTYRSQLGGTEAKALRDVRFTVEEGEFVAIMGESGSGKTTLLNILALLDQPTQGSICLNGQEITTMNDAQAAAFRRSHLGYVFQDFNLLDTFTLEDNIKLPLVLAGEDPKDMTIRMLPVVQRLQIEKLLQKYPYEVSGGEKQRAAVARALIMKPLLILADEPTGALDSHATDELLRYFGALHADGHTILMVTHSVKAASVAGRVLFIKDGKIFHQLYRGDRSPHTMYEEITQTLTMLTKGEQ